MPPKELTEFEPFEADFRSIAEAMPQLVWTADGSGEIDYLNRRWVDYTGLDLKAFRRRDAQVGVVHADEAEEAWAGWRDAVASGTPYEHEHRLRRRDGAYRWFLARAVPMFSANGKVTRWIGTATDVDEQKRARQSLSFMVEAGNVLATLLDVESICKSLADVTVRSFADWCFVTLLEDGRFNTVAMAHRDRERLQFIEQFRDRYPPQPGDMLSRVVEQNEPVLIERVKFEQLEAAARDAEHLRLLESLRMQSVMLVPLTASGGTVYGAVTIVSAESGRIFDQSDLHVAMDVAARAATSIGNARIVESERRVAQRLRFTGRVNTLLFEASDPWKAMERVAELIAFELADACAILRLREDTVRTEVIVHRDPRVSDSISALRGRRTLRFPVEREIAERLRRHETIVFANEEPGVMKERAWPYLAAEMEALDLRSSVILPLHAGSATYGALVAYYSERAFDSRELQLLEEIAARASVAVEHAETLERERRIATTLQRASLPAVIPRPNDLRFDTVYLPAGDEGEVGGDWYDVVDLDDGSVVVSVGDVTGRGIEAAAIMSKVRHAMGMAPLHETDPTKILDSAGWFLAKRYPNAIVTAFVAIISADRRSIRFSNAGHPLPMLWRDGELIQLEAYGLPLGLRTFAASESGRTLELRDADILVLFTDGLVEATRDLLEGEKALRAVMATGVLAASAAPAKLIARSCLPSEVHDDVAILTVSVGAPPAWTFAAEDARAAVDARTLFVTFLRGATSDTDLIDRAELVFGELLGNVVRHAPGPIEITYQSAGDTRVLHLIDSGEPFSLAGSHLPEDVLSELGRGLFIVAQLAAAVRVDHIPNLGNHISVTL